MIRHLDTIMILSLCAVVFAMSFVAERRKTDIEELTAELAGKEPAMIMMAQRAQELQGILEMVLPEFEATYNALVECQNRGLGSAMYSL